VDPRVGPCKGKIRPRVTFLPLNCVSCSPQIAENTREDFSWGFLPVTCEQRFCPGWNAWSIIAHHRKGREVPPALRGDRGGVWKPSTFLLMLAASVAGRSLPAHPVSIAPARQCYFSNQLQDKTAGPVSRRAEVWKVRWGIKLVLPSVLTCENTTY